MADERISVVVPTHSDSRRQQLTEAVASVQAQQPAPARIVVSVDHNPALHDWAHETLRGVTVVANQFAPGASGNRNTGIRHTDTPLVALLDDDTRARPGWLAGLADRFADPDVVGCGGAVSPAWLGPRPRWFPDELLWVVGCSHAAMPVEAAPVRNVWSCNMALRRDAFEAVGGFRLGFGKLGDRARPEDTDLCLRMSETTGGQWLYVPQARVDHVVPPQRATLRFVLSRCFNEGEGKVELGRLHRGIRAMRVEQAYMSRVLPRAVARGLLAAVRGRGGFHASRSVVIAAGAVAAGLGLATGALRGRSSRFAG